MNRNLVLFSLALLLGLSSCALFDNGSVLTMGEEELAWSTIYGVFNPNHSDYEGPAPNQGFNQISDDFVTTTQFANGKGEIRFKAYDESDPKSFPFQDLGVATFALAMADSGQLNGQVNKRAEIQHKFNDDWTFTKPAPGERIYSYYMQIEPGTNYTTDTYGGPGSLEEDGPFIGIFQLHDQRADAGAPAVEFVLQGTRVRVYPKGLDVTDAEKLDVEATTLAKDVDVKFNEGQWLHLVVHCRASRYSDGFCHVYTAWADPNRGKRDRLRLKYEYNGATIRSDSPNDEFFYRLGIYGWNNTFEFTSDWWAVRDFGFKDSTDQRWIRLNITGFQAVDLLTDDRFIENQGANVKPLVKRFDNLRVRKVIE